MDPGERFNPFPGLRSFEPDEDHLFFGRETQVDELLRRLRITRFLGVVGGSGSGKSSLVKSGLIPALHGGFMVTAGPSWRVALLRPGGDPIHNLSLALNTPDVLGGDEPVAELSGMMLDSTLRRNGQGLVDAVRQARVPQTDNILIIVDQFEELFRFKEARSAAGGRDEAVAFVKLLLGAAHQTELPIYVVLTMRSEFIGRCAECPGLAEAVNDGQYLVPRLTRDELRLAITGPIAVGGGVIAPRLVTRVLNEVGDDPDQLPVLQHALMRTWDHWASHQTGQQPIDVDDYEAIGTMKNALSLHADEAFNELLTDRSRALAQALFKALTETSGQGLGLRRPSQMKALSEIAGASHDEIVAVLDQFRMPGRTLLVPAIDTPLTPSTIVDLSHESLMRLWSRLIAWTEEEARSAQIYRRLGIAAALYARQEAGLWRDPELQLAVNWREEQRPTPEWAKRYDDGFERAMVFLATSQEARDAEVAAEAAAAAERRRREQTIRRLAFAVLAVSLFGTVGVVWLGRRAMSAQRTAQLSQSAADRSQRAADAARAEAIRLQSDVEAARVEIGRTKRVADADRVEADQTIARANETATSANQRAVANLLAIDASQAFRDKPASVGASALLAIEAIRLDRDHFVALASHTLFDIVRLLPPFPTTPAKQGHTRDAQLSVDRAGRFLVTSGADRTVVLWDFQKREIRRVFPDSQGGVLSSDGRWIAVMSETTTDIWDIQTGAMVKRLPLGNASLAFSPDGSVLAVLAGLELDPGNPFSSQPGDGYLLLGQLRQFNTLTGAEIPSSSPPVSEIAFSPKGELVLVTREGIQAYSIRPSLIPNTKACHSVVFDGEGDLVALCPKGLMKVVLATGTVKPLTLPKSVDTAGIVQVNVQTERTPRELFVGISPPGAVTAFDGDGNEFLRLPESVTSLAVPSTGEWIATGNKAGEVLFWRLEPGMIPQPLDYKGGSVDLTFSHDEKWLATVAPNGAIRILDVRSRRPIQTIQLPPRARRPRFSPDDSVLAVLYDHELRLIRTPRARTPGDGRNLAWSPIGGDLGVPADGPALSLTFSDDSSLLIVAGQGSVRRFRLNADRTALSALPSLPMKRDDEVFVSRDRRWLAGVTKGRKPDASATVWDGAALETRPISRANLQEPVWLKLYPASAVEYAALSGDTEGGDWRLEAGGEVARPVLGILERKTGFPLGRIPHKDPVAAFAISRNGNWIATTTQTILQSEFGPVLREPSDTEGQTFLWQWGTQGPIALTCSLIPSNLTSEEWKRSGLESLGLGSRRDTCPLAAR